MLQNEKINISVIFPAHNEQNNIIPLIEKTVRAFKDNNYSGEIVLVNDGSTDGTGQEAEQIAQKYPLMRVVHHLKNRGLTEALMTGFKNVRGEIIVFLCADLQSDPEEDIPILVEEVKKGYDLVLGWRQGRDDGRKAVSKVYHLLCKMLFGISVHDMNWIKAFRREVVDGLNLRSDWHRFIPILVGQKGYKIKEVKTNCYPRQHGKSKFIGKGRILIGFLDLLVVKFVVSFLDKPMFLFGGLGLIFIGLGFLTGLYIMTYLILTGFKLHVGAGVYATFMFFTFCGLMLFSLGLIAEYLATLREEINSIKKAGK